MVLVAVLILVMCLAIFLVTFLVAVVVASVQRAVLNVELVDLQHHLMQAWRLPSLLVEITDDHARRETSQLANVRLAIRVARHSALGWDNPALPDDLADIGALLQLSVPHVERLLQDIDAG